MHPTLVSLKNLKTASVAFSSQSYLAEEASGVSARRPFLYPSTAHGLRALGPALREQMVAGLPLSSPACQHLSSTALWTLSLRYGPMAA